MAAPRRIVGGTLGKGCLAGLGLALLFLVIGGVLYLLMSLLGLPQNLRLLIAIASGPIIGTALVIPVVWTRAVRATSPAEQDQDQAHETASGNGA